MKSPLLIPGRPRDLGGFSVRRILPHPTHRMVGPFIFFDHMGPAEFAPGQGLDVRPHPHINLATVTYLFSGRIFHRDSLGSSQAIEPGAINWMTAGRGITHSERSTPEDRASGSLLHGIQCWVALPKDAEEVEPSFVHHPAATIPEKKIGDGIVRVLLGEAFGLKSPVKTHSPITYLDGKLNRGQQIEIPANGQDLAVYLVEGELTISEQKLDANSMFIAAPREDLRIEAQKNSRFLVLGGEPMEEKIIWWNFVSSSRNRILQAMDDWKEGRFPKVPGDELEFIPLPDDPLPSQKSSQNS